MLDWSFARASMSVTKRATLLLAAMICVASANPGLAAGEKGSPDPFPPIKLQDFAVAILPVSGAPGNGNQCLQDALQTALRERGVRISEPAQNVYTIQGEADFTRKDAAWTHAVVRWTVRSLLRPEFKRSFGIDREFVASTLEKDFCGEAAAIAASSAVYGVLEAASAKGDVQSASGNGHDENNARDEWTERRERIRSETRALFDSIWKDTRRPDRCELDIKWLSYSIPEDNAAKWLGVHVHTDLEFTGVRDYNFQDSIGPNDIFSGAFCGDTRFREYERSLDEKGPASVPSDPDGTHGAVHRREYSFPVFNKNFTRAVLTVSQDVFFVGSHNFAGSTSALLYVKKNGVWKLQGRDELASWE